MAYLSAHGLRCIAYDRRGDGRSVESAAGYEFNTLSDHLSAVMQQLDLQGVTLVAHSMVAANWSAISRYTAAAALLAS
jgi:non-heme chloroperoxidase